MYPNEQGNKQMKDKCHINFIEGVPKKLTKFHGSRFEKRDIDRQELEILMNFPSQQNYR